MPNHEYITTEFITVNFNITTTAVVAKWLVSPTSVEFREGLDAMLAAMKKFNTGKLVVDTTNLGAIHEEDQNWAASDWYNRARQGTGYHRIAMIVPSDIFTQMSVESTLESVEEKIVDTAYFDSIDAALEWITH